ncbi:hypothetical protein DAEQUDRAFT_814444 [Daedalea quercina L-15889]|uniref:Uncharacterized protein n=1 Tax=Daedalea quercina L-15889 TaxID=1314783 RepID=A0A165M3Q2_9APHY|nr:hypothetical protein DAEQUDRAFT_814444 [Daedalea quercina L-15889]
MSNLDGDAIAEACCGLCCICCGEGFTSWMQITRCCQGSSTQAGCCGPCCKKSFDDDDWVEKERAQRQRGEEAHVGNGPSAGVVDEQPTPRASMEASRPQEDGAEAEEATKRGGGIQAET